MAKKSLKKVAPTKAKSAAKKKTAASKPAKPSKVQVEVKGTPVKKGVTRGYSKSELAYFRDLIVERKKEILEDLEMLKANMMDVTTGEYVAENSSYSLHMEQGTDTMEREKTFLFASREGKYLQYLEDALERIKKGTYGVCTDCGKLIDKGRLEAVPNAQLCVSCKLKKSNKAAV